MVTQFLYAVIILLTREGISVFYWMPPTFTASPSYFLHAVGLDSLFVVTSIG